MSSITKATHPNLVPLSVSSGYRTDVGPSRASNEDSVIVVAPTDAACELDKGILAMVADGMGGHEGGEVASAIAVQRIPDIYYRNPADPQPALQKAFEAANLEIFETARRKGELTGMGTTCTAIAIVNGQAYCCHVGDSRAYLVRAGQIYCMTEDHSATMAMVKQGLLTLAEARNHEERNVILRAMGTHPTIEVACWETPFPLRPGDRFVLCSDGLYETIEDLEIAAIATAHNAQAICDRLIQLAIDRNCSDNISVAVLQMAGTP